MGQIKLYVDVIKSTSQVEPSTDRDMTSKGRIVITIQTKKKSHH